MAFDNLRKIQPRLAAELERVSGEGMMPQSLLFSGVPGSGRLTAALDLAFFITDDDENTLSSEHVVYFASRPFRPELRAATKLFLSQRTRFSRIFFIRTVRRILLQYHSSIASLHRESAGVRAGNDRMEGDRTVFSAASALDEFILSVEEDRDYSEEEIKSVTEGVAALLTDPVLSVGRKTQGATIDEIRAVQDWLMEGIDEKVVIFENAEDYTEGAKNSLLKLLEEPPEHTHLILLSARPGRLLETILSRVRKFTFPELPGEGVSSFIMDNFHISGAFTSFDDFFFREGADDGEREAMDGFVDMYSSALISGKVIRGEDEESLFTGLERIDGFRYFRESVTAKVMKALEDGTVTPGRASLLWKALSSSLDLADTYNMSIRHALDLALREARSVR